MKLLLTVLWSSLMLMTSNIAQATEINIKVSNINVALGGDVTVFIFGEKGFPKVHKKALVFQTKLANKATWILNFL